MKKLWTVGGVLAGVAMLFGLIYLVFGALAIFTLEARYDALRDGLTVEDTDKIMGGLFRARTISWDDIPEIYTGHCVERPGSVVRDYRFRGIRVLNIVVIYDEDERSYLHIPIYE